MKYLVLTLAVLASVSASAQEYVQVYVPEGKKVVLVDKDAPEVLIAITVIETEKPSDEPSDECDGLVLGPGAGCGR